ncbi:MAG: hypothetical protein EOL95_10210 [Bacteroidia bacterium]|nr:hypothetical protein [Bacteroidia bacterium]
MIDYKKFEDLYKVKSPIPDIPNIQEFNPVPNGFTVPNLPLPVQELDASLDSMFSQFESIKNTIENKVTETISTLTGIDEVPSVDDVESTINSYKDEVSNKIDETIGFNINNVTDVNLPFTNFDIPTSAIKGMASDILQNNVRGLIQDKKALVEDSLSQLNLPGPVTTSLDKIDELSSTLSSLNLSSMLSNIDSISSALESGGENYINKINDMRSQVSDFLSNNGLDALGNVSLDGLLQKTGIPAALQENLKGITQKAEEISDFAESKVQTTLAKNAEKYYNCLK